MSDLRAFGQISPGDISDVGGKGLSLGLMVQAGLPVPPGFCVTSAAHRRLQGNAPSTDAELAVEIADAYRALGGGLVAVRSSATAEDGAVTSFAGQQETVLGATGEEAVLNAVARCWASLDSERAVAYRRRQQVGDDGLSMAVVVQRLVPAEVAGVLFTHDPMDAGGKQMLVEASWGLGESVVSGRVTPDRFHVERETGAVLARHINIKATQWTSAGPAAVPLEKQTQPCLNDNQLKELAELARRVETYYGDARDVEWAWADGCFWLLQARPITTGGAAEREQVRLEEIESLKTKADPRGTVWSRFNLSESLPEPTPMTWAIVRRFMSGKGGFGLLYRDLGFDADPALDEEGIYDLVCGRPYCNLSREPRMLSRVLPYEHPFAALKAAPQKALYPTPVPNPARAGWRFWLLFPIHFCRDVATAVKRNQLSETFPERFRKEIVPGYLQIVATESARKLSELDDQALLQRLETLIRVTLVEFARDSLKPTALAAFSRGNLQRALAHRLGPDRTQTALGELVMGVKPDPETDLSGALRDLAAGRLSRERFLENFGHRGSQEMELSQPRWVEDPSAVDRLIARKTEGLQPIGSSETHFQRIADEAKLGPTQRPVLEKEIGKLHAFLALRESAKHHLLKGYALIRAVLLELDRRYRLDGGIFYLKPDELPRLKYGDDFSKLIAARRRRRALALSLEVPHVLFSDDLDAIGRPVTIAGADVLQGVPLSAGAAEGPALVLLDPILATLPPDPYILVCPSTDPAWVPLFAQARGLVMETGGVLSHGAIVAREFGLPAVAGLPDVQRRLRTGQRLRVDGGTGTVTVLPAS
jgi:phosphohistidine swiveling domain-containing protein